MVKKNTVPPLQLYDLYTDGPGRSIQKIYANNRSSETWAVSARAVSWEDARSLLERQQVADSDTAVGVVAIAHSDWEAAERNWPWKMPKYLLGADEM